MNTAPVLSLPSDERSTPQNLFDRLSAKYGPFDLDVCASQENAKCKRFFTVEDDGLRQRWFGRVWMNCPYSRGNQRLWVERAIRAVVDECLSVTALLPADTSTVLWHDLVLAYASHIEFLRGRQKFSGAESGAKFGSAVVTFRRAGSGQLKLLAEASP